MGLGRRAAELHVRRSARLTVVLVMIGPDRPVTPRPPRRPQVTRRPWGDTAVTDRTGPSLSWSTSPQAVTDQVRAGRWPGALAVIPDDRRDELLMFLTLTEAPGAS